MPLGEDARDPPPPPHAEGQRSSLWIDNSLVIQINCQVRFPSPPIPRFPNPTPAQVADLSKLNNSGHLRRYAWKPGRKNGSKIGSGSHPPHLLLRWGWHRNSDRPTEFSRPSCRSKGVDGGGGLETGGPRFHPSGNWRPRLPPGLKSKPVGWGSEARSDRGAFSFSAGGGGERHGVGSGGGEARIALLLRQTGS